MDVKDIACESQKEVKNILLEIAERKITVTWWQELILCCS